MNLEKDIIGIISKIGKLPEKELQTDTKLFDSNIVTSLGLLEILSEIEKRFGITVMPEELIPDNFGTIALICTFVDAKIKGTR